MAFIKYLSPEQIPVADRVPDQDNIIQVHGVHSKIMRQHYELYRELMYGPGPLSRIQRELLALAISARNACHY